MYPKKWKWKWKYCRTGQRIRRNLQGLHLGPTYFLVWRFSSPCGTPMASFLQQLSIWESHKMQHCVASKWATAVLTRRHKEKVNEDIQEVGARTSWTCHICTSIVLMPDAILLPWMLVSWFMAQFQEWSWEPHRLDELMIGFLLVLVKYSLLEYMRHKSAVGSRLYHESLQMSHQRQLQKHCHLYD